MSAQTYRVERVITRLNIGGPSIQAIDFSRVGVARRDWPRRKSLGAGALSRQTLGDDIRTLYWQLLRIGGTISELHRT